MKSSVIPIFLSKINAARKGHFASTKVNYSSTVFRILNMLHEAGIIRGYHMVRGENKIKVILKYIKGNNSLFKEMVLVSRPGKKVYVTKLDLYKLKERNGGNTLYILSTPKGILFDAECIMYQTGGEVLLKIFI